MIEKLRSFTKTLPSLFTALALAIAVWIMAVTSSDPSLEKAYPNPVPIEIIGQASSTVINTILPNEVSLTLRAPTSIWNSLLGEKVPVRAIMDLEKACTRFQCRYKLESSLLKFVSTTHVR
jgi:hypothetical protein